MTTACGPRAWIRFASSAASPSGSPVSVLASGRLGVTTVAFGSSVSISAPRASGSSRTAPDSDTITGSRTTGVACGSASSSARATASIVARSPSIPILTASTPMSSWTARTWAKMISGGIAWTAVTPTVFCAVIAVIAVIPCTPQAANALRSAWMPAPPPESLPAIESTLGSTPPSVPRPEATAIYRQYRGKSQSRSGGDPETTAGCARHESRELQGREGGEPAIGVEARAGEGRRGRLVPLGDRREQRCELGGRGRPARLGSDPLADAEQAIEHVLRPANDGRPPAREQRV